MLHNHSEAFRAGARRRAHMKPSKKIATVMGEYKHGSLHSGSGKIVTNRRQAIAIALSEARKARKRRKKNG